MDQEWWDQLDPEEQAAWNYANAADGNPIDEFTPLNKLMMKTAFLAGVEWERKRWKNFIDGVLV